MVLSIQGVYQAIRKSCGDSAIEFSDTTRSARQTKPSARCFSDRMILIEGTGPMQELLDTPRRRLAKSTPGFDRQVDQGQNQKQEADP
jgi:hypothetical protein